MCLFTKRFLTVGCLGLAIALLLPLVMFGQQNRGIGVRVKMEGGQTQEIKFYDDSYALLIGMSNYNNRDWRRLPGVKDDIRAVRSVLETKHGFQVIEADDLTRVTWLTR